MAYWVLLSTEKLQDLLSAASPNYSSAETPNGCKVVCVKLRTENQIYTLQYLYCMPWESRVTMDPTCHCKLFLWFMIAFFAAKLWSDSFFCPSTKKRRVYWEICWNISVAVNNANWTLLGNLHTTFFGFQWWFRDGSGFLASLVEQPQ